MFNITLNQLAVLLISLRYFQKNVPPSERPAIYKEMFLEENPPLTDTEIDNLCLNLNTELLTDGSHQLIETINEENAALASMAVQLFSGMSPDEFQHLLMGIESQSLDANSIEILYEEFRQRLEKRTKTVEALQSQFGKASS